MRNLKSLFLLLAAALLALLPALPAAAVTLDATFSKLAFENTVKIGQYAPEGFSYRYPNVITIGGTQVDAIVTVKDVTATTVNNVDRVSSTDNWQLWSNLQIGSGTQQNPGGSTTYNVAFLKSGSDEPVTLKNVAINVGDIDAKQFVQFSGVQSYTLASPSLLAVQTTVNNATIPAGAYRFAETNNAGADDSDRQFWAQVKYLQISSVDVVLGATKGGSALFQVAFGAADWGVTPTTDVTPTPASYAVSYALNGGTGASAPASTSQPGGTDHVIAAAPSGLVGASNAAFVGWNTAPDGTGVMYSAGQSITPTTDVTLYAIFQSTNTLSYDGNQASAGSPPAATTLAGEQTVAAPGSLLRDGYSFAGWNTQADGLGQPYEPGEGIFPSGNVTLYAQWVAKPVVPDNSPIEIDLQPGEPIEGANVPYVVPNLEPGTDWTIEVVPTGGGEPIPLDAGTVPETGEVFGETALPNLPAGQYELTFEATAGGGGDEEIRKLFSVGADGTLQAKQDGVTRPASTPTKLPATGLNAAPLIFTGAAAATFGSGVILSFLVNPKRSARGFNRVSD